MRFFDLHCDTLTKTYETKQSLFNNNLAVDFNKGQVFSKWTQCFAVWIDDKCQNPFDFYKKVLLQYKHYKQNAPKNLTPILTVENGSLFENDILRVEKLKKDGVKAITLTWNNDNCIASGVKAKGGLKPFGREVIGEMNRLKIACDLSHINTQGFFEALRLTDYPFASHSCCDAVKNHPRNLTDKQILKILDKNGIIGICLYPLFCGADIFAGVYQNILHLINLGATENIAIGTDFDGCDMPNELSNITKIVNLYKFLQRKNITEQTLEKIFYENAKNFFLRL